MGMSEIARPIDEWCEEDGNVLWWAFPVEEPPYVGTPNDTGEPFEVRTNSGIVAAGMFGGWPGYHTHWTPLPPIPTPASEPDRG